MEEEIKKDQELYSYFRARDDQLCKDNFKFLLEHPEVKFLLNDYLSNILLHKPDDVFKFTKDYFKILSPNGNSNKFVVLVGPDSVGKTTFIKKLSEEFPNIFEIPRFACTKEKENTILLSKDDFIALSNNKEMLYYHYDNIEKEYEGLTLGEIKRIIEGNKIALVETDLTNAKKIDSISSEANFIGILPPSLDSLRERIKKNKKLNTATINAILEKSEGEIKDIETLSFIGYRIVNDIEDVGYYDFKNAIISLFPYLKYTKEYIQDVMNLEPKKLDETPKNIGKINEQKNEYEGDGKKTFTENISSMEKGNSPSNKSRASDNKLITGNENDAVQNVIETDEQK